MSKNTVSRMMMNRSRKIEKRKAEIFRGGNGKWYRGDGSGVEVKGDVGGNVGGSIGGKGMGKPEIVGIDWSSEWIEKRKGEIREKVEKEWRERMNGIESGMDGENEGLNEGMNEKVEREVEKRLREEMRKMEEDVKRMRG